MSKLSEKEAFLFDRSIDQFEKGQYSKSLKTIQSVLKKKPKHPDSVALLGLNLCKLHDSRSALLKCGYASSIDPKSQFCWHALAIVYRETKDYNNSLKCYQNALAISPNNESLWYDAAYLQAQLGLYQPLFDNWNRLLQLDSSNLEYRLCFTLSAFLSGNYKESLEQIQYLISSCNLSPLVVSRLISFLPRICEHIENGSQTVLEILLMNQNSLLNNFNFEHIKAGLAFRQKNYEESIYLYARLLIKFPNRLDYSEKYLNSLWNFYKSGGLSLDLLLKRTDFLIKTFSEILQTGISVLIFLLSKNLDYDFCLNHLISYSMHHFIPSFISLLKIPLKTNDPFSKKLITMLSNFREGDSAKNIPTHKLWCTYCLCLAHYKLGDYEESNYWLNLAIDHTPTYPELFLAKAKIFLCMGKIEEALCSFKRSVELDKSDRALASKYAKYLIRMDRNEEAYIVLSKFSRFRFGGVCNYLAETECVWFLVEDGESLLRQKLYGLALKRFHSIYQIYKKWSFLKFDYFTQCAEDGEFQEYIELVEWSDNLWSSTDYLRATLGALTIYLLLFESKFNMYGNKAEEISHMSEVEQIAYAREDNKKIMKLQKIEEDKIKSYIPSESEEPLVIDEDYFGHKLLITDDPLTEAMRFLQPICWHKIKGWGFLKILSSKLYKLKGIIFCYYALTNNIEGLHQKANSLETSVL